MADRNHYLDIMTPLKTNDDQIDPVDGMSEVDAYAHCAVSTGLQLMRQQEDKDRQSIERPGWGLLSYSQDWMRAVDHYRQKYCVEPMGKYGPTIDRSALLEVISNIAKTMPDLIDEAIEILQKLKKS